MKIAEILQLQHGSASVPLSKPCHSGDHVSSGSHLAFQYTGAKLCPCREQEPGPPCGSLQACRRILTVIEDLHSEGAACNVAPLQILVSTIYLQSL